MEREVTKIANSRGILDWMRRELEEAQRGDIELSHQALRKLHEGIANLEQHLRDLGVEDPDGVRSRFAFALLGCSPFGRKQVALAARQKRLHLHRSPDHGRTLVMAG